MQEWRKGDAGMQEWRRAMQGWRSCETARLSGSIPGPGFTCGLSLLLVLLPAPRVFLRVLRFSSRHKNAKFQFDPEIRATLTK